MNEIDTIIIGLIDILKSLGKIRFEKDFAESIGISKQHLYAIKSGDRHFNVQHIYMVSKKYNVDPSYLMGMQKEIFFEPTKRSESAS
tara:strand:+ start:3146 stop:3406 length:261 start_codon:yes stop_codon:yes gene_type:complete